MNINEIKMIFFNGCQMVNQGLTCKIRTMIKSKSWNFYQRTPTALVINTLQNGGGVRKFLSNYGLTSENDFRHLFIDFENYKIPIFVVIEDLYSKVVRLTERSNLADVPSNLLMAKTCQLLPRTNRSAFSATDLDKELNRLGIRKIIFTGEMTPSGLASTRRDAELLGYHAAFARNIAEIDDKLIKVKYSVNGTQGRIPGLSEINLL